MNPTLQAAFEAWAIDNLGQGYSLATDEGSYECPVTRWAFAVWRARQKEIDTLLEEIEELRNNAIDAQERRREDW